MLPRDAVPETYPPTKPIPTDKKTFEYFAAFVWGSVMWLFAERRQNLQAGLVNSMDCELDNTGRVVCRTDEAPFCHARSLRQCGEVERVSVAAFIETKNMGEEADTLV